MGSLSETNQVDKQWRHSHLVHSSIISGGSSSTVQLCCPVQKMSKLFWGGKQQEFFKSLRSVKHKFAHIIDK